MEQLERARRYLERMRTVYAGIFAQSHDKDLYEDDVVSFFMHCYHVRDWILHLNNVGVTSKELEEFINQHEEMRVCADLCNGAKHYRLTKTPRSGAKPHLGGRNYRSSTWLTGGGGGEVVKAQFSIVTSNGVRDALEIAEKCMSLWDAYVKGLSARA